jgi:hypothetical protein
MQRNLDDSREFTQSSWLVGWLVTIATYYTGVHIKVALALYKRLIEKLASYMQRPVACWE